MTANVNLILHAHLPYVRHLEYPKFLEESWLFEALNETYIPLLRLFYKLEAEGVPFQLSICFSPTLCTMMNDEPLRDRFIDYMNSRAELAEKEVARCKKEAPEFLDTAKGYQELILDNLEFYLSKDRDLLSGYKYFADRGNLELLATAATNAYLPLYSNYPTAVKAQVEIGVKCHERFFGRSPQGFWLPECGYYPGLETILEDHNIKWVQLPSHSVFTAKNKIESAGFSPLKIGSSSVSGFVRDWSLTNLVWSNSSGYPCDPDYRDFYRDIGYELPLDYIRPYIQEPDVRVFTGFKYWAITGKNVDKRAYNIDKATEKCKLHAENFIYHIRRRAIAVSSEMQSAPVINLCFDADLFGHRWFEGIMFLGRVLALAANDEDLNFTQPSLMLSTLIKQERAQLNQCSWGDGGYSDPWLDESNKWVYRHTHKAIEGMEELAERFPNQPSLKGRFLNQASREVMLAMASDWPYIMHDRTSVSYAEKRVRNHVGSFNVVYSNMCRNAVNTEWLIKSERRNDIFPEMDYNLFRKESE